MHVTTALGREVRVGDWRALHEDTILNLLFGRAESLFNVDQTPVELRSVLIATGLGAEDCKSLLDALTQRKLVETLAGERYRITADGTTHVQWARARLAPTGSYG